MSITRQRCLCLLAISIAPLASHRGHSLGVVHAQQSAAGQNTLIGVTGRDFVMMGADSNSAGGGGGIALTSSNADNIAVVHDGGGFGFGGRPRRRYPATSLPGGGGGEEEVSTTGGSVAEREELWRRESLEQQAIAVAFAGDFADAERLVGGLKSHATVREYESGIGNDVTCVFDGGRSNTRSDVPAQVTTAVSSAGLDAESIAYLARNEVASRLRSAQPLNVCLLVGGMVRCARYSRAPSSSSGGDGLEYLPLSGRVQKQVATVSASYKSEKGSTQQSEDLNAGVSRLTASESSETHADGASNNPFLAPRLLWLDQYGSIQNLNYGAHGFGSNFCLSVLDQGYRPDLTREEAEELIRDCFDQLRKRYVINSPKAPCIKCIDADGVKRLVEKEGQTKSEKKDNSGTIGGIGRVEGNYQHGGV